MTGLGWGRHSKGVERVPAILGIDAAWTATEPSGIALLRGDASAWKCVAVSPSYSSFLAAAAGVPVNWSTAPTPSEPDVDALLGAARTMLNDTAVDLVTIDMPVATTPITGRRAADKAISTTFGGRGCSVHTPNAQRPGFIADLVRSGFAALGVSTCYDHRSPGELSRSARGIPAHCVARFAGRNLPHSL